MSTIMMALFWPVQIPPTPKAVLISLADNANDQGECWPSIATIATRTCFSERAVQEAIKYLEAARLVYADRTNGRHTRYRLLPPQQAHPRSNSTPAAGAPVGPSNPRSTRGGAAAAPPQQAHPSHAAGAPDPRSSCGGPPQQVPTNRQEPSENRQPPARERAHEGEGNAPRADVPRGTDATEPRPVVTDLDDLTSFQREVVSPYLPVPEGMCLLRFAEFVQHRKVAGSVLSISSYGAFKRDVAGLAAEGVDINDALDHTLAMGYRRITRPLKPRAKPARPRVSDNFESASYQGTASDELPAELR